MSSELQQLFPKRADDGSIIHKRWKVDLDAATELAAWTSRGARARLQRETAEMAQHFPRWLLTASDGRDRVCCRRCGSALVFDRGLRCVECDTRVSRSRLPSGALLSWFGLMPPIGVDGLARLRKRLTARPPAHHVLGQRADLGHYLLVPLVATYPRIFPASPPRVAYLAGLFKVRGMPAQTASHAYHMYSGGFMCLFAPGEWRHLISCRELLQQRAYAHVIKLLNYADGKRAAFDIVS